METFSCDSITGTNMPWLVHNSLQAQSLWNLKKKEFKLSLDFFPFLYLAKKCNFCPKSPALTNEREQI